MSNTWNSEMSESQESRCQVPHPGQLCVLQLRNPNADGEGNENPQIPVHCASVAVYNYSITSTLYEICVCTPGAVSASIYRQFS
jgi:hypothetical protein